jgi:hypothetical protein
MHNSTRGVVNFYNAAVVTHNRSFGSRTAPKVLTVKFYSAGVVAQKRQIGSETEWSDLFVK